MPYHPSIPQSTDDPTDSQPDLLDNFSKINTDYAVNHIALTAGGNSGYHTKLFFPNSLAFTANPNLTPPKSSLYPKVSAYTTNELFFQNINVPTNFQQLTNLPVPSGIITNVILNGVNPVEISLAANHGLVNGNSVTIYGVYGTSQLNGNTYVITVTTPNNFTLNGTNSSLFSAYSSGGFYTTGAVDDRGMATPWGLIINMGNSGLTTTYFKYPFTTSLYTLQVTPITGVITNVTNTLTSFTVTGSVGATYYYLAIGV